MMAIGLKHVFKGAEERISMAGLRDKIRALQPLNSPEERRARARFAQLASCSLTGKTHTGEVRALQSAAQQFEDLRHEAAVRGAR